MAMPLTTGETGHPEWLDRRGFLKWAGRAALGLAGAGLIGATIDAGTAEAGVSEAKKSKKKSKKKKSSSTTATTAAGMGVANVTPKNFTTSLFRNQGDRYNCDDFLGIGQGYAQWTLQDDPNDPNYLDANRDGIACTESDVASWTDATVKGFRRSLPVNQVPVNRP